MSNEPDKNELGVEFERDRTEEGCEKDEIVEGVDIFENTETIKLICNDILPHIGWNNIIIDKTYESCL